MAVRHDVHVRPPGVPRHHHTSHGPGDPDRFTEIAARWETSRQLVAPVLRTRHEEIACGRPMASGGPGSSPQPRMR
jgi:hypothetical protein